MRETRDYDEGIRSFKYIDTAEVWVNLLECIAINRGYYLMPFTLFYTVTSVLLS